MSFLGEIKRRKIFQVAAVYAVVAWLLIQVADVVLPAFDAPTWVLQVVIFLMILGLPITLVISWAFNLTPEGLVRDAGPADSTQGRGRTIEFALIGLLVVAVAFLILDNYVLVNADPKVSLVDVSEPVPGFSDRAAIAVLPFSNLSGDPAQEYFSDGITEEIITELHSIGTFPVIAGTSTFSYKGSATDVREIATALGAGYILEGSVRRSEDQIRIAAQLNDATGRQIWSETYDREFRDVFAVQDDITNHIIGAIEPELLDTEMSLADRVRTEDMQAWDYYLQAAANARALGGGFADRNGQPVTTERTELAIDLAKKAIELDPNFAEAYTMLGHILNTYSGLLRSEVSSEFAAQALKEGINAAREGYQRNPYSATTCSCYVAFLAWIGPVEERNIELALSIQEEAVRVNPANAFVHKTLAQLYVIVERYDEALFEIQLAKRLSPRDGNLTHFMFVEAFIHMSTGNWEPAVTLAQNAVTLSPLNYDAHTTRMVALYALGERENAIVAMREMLGFVPNFSENNVWDVPLPDSLAPIVAPLSESRIISRYQQAVMSIINDMR